MAAECLRALFGVTFDDDERTSVQAFVATVLLAEGLQDLRIIRGALTRKD